MHELNPRKELGNEIETVKGKVYIKKYGNISHSHDFKKVVIWFKLF